MRKGISLSIVGGVVLALVGVFVMITAFTGSFGTSFETTFCKVYRSVAVVFPGSNTPPPSGCETGTETNYIGIEETTKEDLKFKLASAVANCWQQYNGYQTEKEVCEGWNVKKLEGGDVTKNDVTELLQDMEDFDPSNLRMEEPVSQNSFVTIQYRYENGEEFIEVN